MGGAWWRHRRGRRRSRKWWIIMAGLVWASARTGLEDAGPQWKAKNWTTKCPTFAMLPPRCILPVLWGLDHDEERRLHTKLVFRATDILFCHPTAAYSSFRPAFGVPLADLTIGGFLRTRRRVLALGSISCDSAERSPQAFDHIPSPLPPRAAWAARACR